MFCLRIRHQSDVGAALLYHLFDRLDCLRIDLGRFSSKVHRGSIIGILSLHGGIVASDDDSLGDLTILTLDQQVLHYRRCVNTCKSFSGGLTGVL